MGMRRRKIIRQLRGDRQQRLLIQVGVGHRQQQVCSARPQRRDHDAWLTIEFSVNGGCKPCIRFVPHQHEVDARLPQLVDQDEHLAAGQAEGFLDARAGQRRGDRSGGIHRAP